MIKYALDLTKPELDKLKFLVRNGIIDTICPERSRVLDQLFNLLNAVDRRG